MTIEGIIRMAKEAGFADEEIDYCQQILIHFAILVASAERDRMCEQFNLFKELAHEKAKSNEAN